MKKRILLFSLVAAALLAAPTDGVTEVPTEAPTATPTAAATNTPTPTTEPVATITPTPLPTAEPTAPVPEDADLISLINRFREEKSLSAIAEDETLSMCAAVRLAEMKSTGLSHERPDGSPFGSVFAVYGLTGTDAVELVYENQSNLTPEAAMEAFFASKSHQQALAGEWDQIGIAEDGQRVVVLLLRTR